MKIRIRPDDASMLQMNDWLAELRDDGSAEPFGEGGGGTASGDARPEALAEHAAPADGAVPADCAAALPASAARGRFPRRLPRRLPPGGYCAGGDR